MSFHKHILASLSLALLAATPALATSDVYLIYPQSWCETDPGELLHFTTAELGVEIIYGFTEPNHGRVFLDPSASPDEYGGGYYLPRCTGLKNAGFDFFQVTDGATEELISVTVLLGDGDPQQRQEVEGAAAGVVVFPWQLVWDDPSPGKGVQIVEWPAGGGLDGTHGFQVAGTQEADSYLKFDFEEEFDAFQPPVNRGEGNNGVETTIIIRPPSGLPRFFAASPKEQIVYATGFFDGSSPPGTALRMRSVDGEFSIRAEASSTLGPVTTSWCDLETGVPNSVYVHHAQALDGAEDSLTLRIGSEQNPRCEDAIGNFVSLHPPAPEHRFGVMDAQHGGLPFDFDVVTITSVRYKAELEGSLLDDFEQGSWSNQWVPVNPTSLHVNPGAAHTGQFGLEIRPTQEVSYLQRTFPVEGSKLACRFSLDAGFSSPKSNMPEVLAFSAQSNSVEDHVRIWVRRYGSFYQLSVQNGANTSAWISLSRLPATVDFRWTSGFLEFWVRGCGPIGLDCGIGHRLESASTGQITSARVGAIQSPHITFGVLTLDNIVCLTEPEPSLAQ